MSSLQNHVKTHFWCFKASRSVLLLQTAAQAGGYNMAKAAAVAFQARTQSGGDGQMAPRRAQRPAAGWGLRPDTSTSQRPPAVSRRAGLGGDSVTSGKLLLDHVALIWLPWALNRLPQTWIFFFFSHFLDTVSFSKAWSHQEIFIKQDQITFLPLRTWSHPWVYFVNCFVKTWHLDTSSGFYFV